MGRARPQGGQGLAAWVQAEPSASSPGETAGLVAEGSGSGQRVHLPLAAPHHPGPLWMLLSRQKLNLLLHRNFCEVRGLNSPEVFA